ncbi:MAG: alginate export family protein [Phycisphaerae bacterium]|nr:alginate export family protein [Phycisphaerae bacterium]
MSRLLGQAAIRLSAGAVLMVCAAAPAQVTNAFLKQQRTLQDEIQRQLDQELTIDQRAAFDFGGTYNFFTFLWDDGVNSSRTLRRHDGRLWARTSFENGTHEGYVRGRFSFIDFNAGDSPNGKDDDWDGPNLERGWYGFSLRRAMQAYAKKTVPYDLRFKIGRQYTEFGTGYALSLPLDAVTLTGELYNFEVTGLMGNTVRSMNDIDQSRPGYHDTDRDFFGVQARYLGLRQHKPFFYAVWNEDKNDESPEDVLQNYDYDSYYLGLGSTGSIVSDNVRYGTEWVLEGGRSFGDRRFLHHDTINAWAWEAMLEYLMPAPSKPRFMLQYMFASGDPDRLDSPTDAVGGNRKDHDDTSFIGFGFRDTGLSFAPRLSNIHVWRAGASFFPFHKFDFLKEVEVGTDWFLYWKHHRSAAVSDDLADLPNGYLGWEMDYYVNWRLTSDLSWTARYGLFFPGDAFSDDTARYFFLTGITWSF